MTFMARRAAGAVLLAALVPAISGLGSAAPKAAAHPRAVLDPALRHTIQAAAAAGKAAATQVIVTGWDRSSLKVLDSLGVTHRHLRALPMAFTKLTAPQIARVLATKNIRSVWGEERLHLDLEESAKLIGARYAADTLKADGKGSVIAVVDTGIDTTHADLSGDKVKYNYEVVAPNLNDPGAPLLVESPMTDDDEHGTHVSGTIAGTGALARTDPRYAGHDLRGIAPAATLIGYSANQGPTLLSTHTIAAFDHIIATRAQTGVRAISNSWGGGGGADFDPNGAIAVAQEAAWNAGIIPVFAAGNSGSPGDLTEDGLNTLSPQCVSPFVVCVAAMTKHKQVVTFSSKGRPDGNWDRAVAQRFHVGLYRPSVTAPGVNITAPAAITSHDADQPHGYLTISGTSMATPEVSGVIALIASANPKLTASQIVNILESTADPLPGWSAHEDGAGAVNARKAVEAALAMKAGKAPILPLPKLSYAAPATKVSEIAKFAGTALPASYVHHSGVTDHHFTVNPGTERIDLQLSWDTQAENMYAFLWEPGVTPNDNPSGSPFATQETWGLLCGTGPCMLDGRKASIRYPKPGDWTLRVFGRTAAASYTAAITAAEFAVPSVSAKAVAGILKGSASFPAPSARVSSLSPLAGTEAPVGSPTQKPVKVYFHDVLPVGGMTIDGSTWNTSAPTSSTPTTWHGIGSDLGTFAEFQSRTTKPLQGALPVSYWAGSTQGLTEWRVKLFAGPAPSQGDDVPIAETTATGGISEQPTQLNAVFANVEVPRDTLLRIQMWPRYINDAHWAVYYDSVDMPSGMVLPEVDRIVPRGLLEVTDAMLDEVNGSGSAVLSWTRVDGASGYRVYAGDTPGALAARLRIAQPAPARGAVAARPKSPLMVAGDILFGNPGSTVPQGSVTEGAFELTCPDAPPTQGLDGFTFPLPPESSDGKQKISVKGASDSLYDLDIHFYDADCQVLSADLATESPDESGVVPEGAAHAVVTNFLGGSVSFTATVARGAAVVGAAKPAKVRKAIGGLRADHPQYYRVAAIDASGKEGRQSEVLVSIPSTLTRVVEVSAAGGPWITVPVAANGTWSVPIASVLRGFSAAAPSAQTFRVRARAGEAVSPTVTVSAAGGFRPVDPGPLPATGVGGGAIGAALLALAAAVGARARYRRPA